MFSRLYFRFSRGISTVSLVKVVNNFISKVNLSFTNDREDDLFVKEVVYYWLFYMLLLIIISLVIFVNEEFDTSLSEVIFEVLFIVWVAHYIPDLWVHGISTLNSKLSTNLGKSISIFLPVIECFSQLIKVLTLGIRLNTNYISGHLLITVFLVLFDFLILSYFLNYSVLMFLFILFIYSLEIFITLLQLYVLCILITLYVQDAAI